MCQPVANLHVGMVHNEALYDEWSASFLISTIFDL